jgi:hypothetical protein
MSGVNKRDKLAIFILIFWGVLFFFIGIYNHYAFKTFTYDYANYNFALWDYAHFRIGPLTTFRGTFLQDHFSLMLMYFVPVHWLMNGLTGTYTLIIIQNGLILLAAWYTYKTVLLKTDNKWVGYGVLMYFFFLFGRYSAFGTDVNLAIMSACLVPVFLYFFEIRKFWSAFIVLALALFSRENMSLWFVFIFLVLIILHWKDRKSVGWAMAGWVISIGFFLFLFRVIIPSIETPDVEYALFNYSALGESPGEALRFMLGNPVETIRLFFINHLNDPEFNGVKLEFYAVYLVSGGFILLARPQYLLWFIPIVAQKVLNDDPFRWGLATYYAVEVVTLLPLSVFLVVATLRSARWQNLLTSLICALTLVVTIYKMDGHNHAVPWTFYQTKIKFYDSGFYEKPFDIRAVNRLLKKIPGDARVSASNCFCPHLAHRREIYFFPTVRDAEYLVFSLFDDNYLMSGAENDKHRRYYLNNPKWEVLDEVYPVYLLKKRNIHRASGKANEGDSGIPDTLYCDFEIIDSVNNHVLLSNGMKADTLDHLTGKLSRSGSLSLALTFDDPYSHSIDFRDLNEVKRIRVKTWVFGNPAHSHIVVDSRAGYYRKGHQVLGQEDSGWQQIQMELWLPPETDLSRAMVYFWNSGEEPVFFDDMEIVKAYR